MVTISVLPIIVHANGDRPIESLAIERCATNLGFHDVEELNVNERTKDGFEKCSCQCSLSHSKCCSVLDGNVFVCLVLSCFGMRLLTLVCSLQIVTSALVAL